MLHDTDEKPLARTFYRLVHVRAGHPLIAAGTDHRFDHDDEANPTSYLGDSVQTVVREVEGGLSAHAGFSARIRPGMYRLVTVRLNLQRVWDCQAPATQAALGPLAQLLTALDHPEELKSLGRAARRAGIQGILWESTKNPGGSCLVVFLENVSAEDLSITDEQMLSERPC